jgi:hypothetical protein
MDFYVECMYCDGHRQGSASVVAAWVRDHDEGGCPSSHDSEKGA